MANSSVTISRSSRDIDGIWDKEVTITLEYTSDDTTGYCPDQELLMLGDYILTEVRPVPDEVLPAENPFSVSIMDDNNAVIFNSGSIAVDDSDPIGGHAGAPTGDYPRMDDSNQVKIADPDNTASSVDIGQSVMLKVILRFEKK